MTRALVAISSAALFVAGCTLDLDALRAGEDAGALDASRSDAGDTEDAGRDAGTIDGGPIPLEDAGPVDAGSDAGSCGAECSPLGMRCDGDEVVTCAPDAMGCASETRTSCEAGLVCDPASAACVSPCSLVAECPRESYCDGDDVVTCGPSADACLVEMGRADCPYACREGMPALCSPNPCPTAIATPLTCGAMISGDTTGTAVLLQNACTPASYRGNEAVYTFRSAQLAAVTIDVAGVDSTGFGYDLFVVDGTEDVTCNLGTCVQARTNTGTSVERATFTAVPGRTYYVIYDRPGNAAGTPFTLNVSCETPACGDGAIQAPETCDDGNTTNGDGCSSSCLAEGGYECAGLPSSCVRLCGNRTVDAIANEDCDDGNTVSADGCSSACRREPGWSCSGEPSACLFRCGNNTVDASAGETCDDGNADPGDGCSSGCAIEAGWMCTGTPSACSVHCGNGAVDPGERCDDGNTTSGDGCAASCLLEAGYRCDATGCRIACGDGMVEADYAEVCDDGNVMDGDGCSRFCLVERFFTCAGTMPSICMRACPNGMVQTSLGETCDDNNITNGDGCSAECLVEAGSVCYGNPSVCGPPCPNGHIDAMEECDDGDAMPADGCDPSCRIEPGFICGGEPSVCAPGCGNGLVDGGDLCDDMNAVGGDGCTGCVLDAGFYCTGEPSTCVAVMCGNSIVEGGESCDPPSAGCSAQCAVPIAPSGMSRMLAGSIDAADPLYERLTQPCSTTGTRRTVHFDTFVIENTTAGPATIDITASWGGDGYLHVYRWPFTPESPEVRCVTGDDDIATGMTLQSQVLDVAVAPGERLVIVASTFNTSPTGPYMIDVRTD